MHRTVGTGAAAVTIAKSYDDNEASFDTRATDRHKPATSTATETVTDRAYVVENILTPTLNSVLLCRSNSLLLWFDDSPKHLVYSAYLYDPT